MIGLGLLDYPFRMIICARPRLEAKPGLSRPVHAYGRGLSQLCLAVGTDHEAHESDQLCSGLSTLTAAPASACKLKVDRLIVTPTDSSTGPGPQGPIRLASDRGRARARARGYRTRSIPYNLEVLRRLKRRLLKIFTELRARHKEHRPRRHERELGRLAIGRLAVVEVEFNGAENVDDREYKRVENERNGRGETHCDRSPTGEGGAWERGGGQEMKEWRDKATEAVRWR